MTTERRIILYLLAGNVWVWSWLYWTGHHPAATVASVMIRLGVF